jgi:hypothetical protein
LTQDKANAAYDEASKAADAAVLKAKTAAAETAEATLGIWERVPLPYPSMETKIHCHLWL